MALNIKAATTPATQPTPEVHDIPFTFNYDQCKSYLQAVVDSQNQYVGIRNHNPFIWINEAVKPLINRLEGISPSGESILREESKELYNAIMALPLNHVPIININAPKQMNQPTLIHTAPALSPRGLNLG